MSEPFYGKVINRQREQDHIEKILSPFRERPADEALFEEVYNLLVHEKFLGRITIPFELVMRKAPPEGGVDYIDVVLDSKV